jgi:nickel transport protein
MIGRAMLLFAGVAVAAPALAHGLLVFARVDGEEVVADAKFSNGNPVKAGEFLVFDGNDVLLTTVEVGPDGTARFPLEGADTGLKIQMDAGDGHEDYWILTPADIEAQRTQ